MTLDLDAIEERAKAVGRTDWRINNRYPGVEEHEALARDVLALAEAYKNVCWDLAVHTFRGRDISLGEEAEAHRRSYLSREPAEGEAK